MKAEIFSCLTLALMVTLPAAARELRTTIVYDDVATDVISNGDAADQLWITTADRGGPRITRGQSCRKDKMDAGCADQGGAGKYFSTGRHGREPDAGEPGAGHQ